MFDQGLDVATYSKNHPERKWVQRPPKIHQCVDFFLREEMDQKFTDRGKTKMSISLKAMVRSIWNTLEQSLIQILSKLCIDSTITLKIYAFFSFPVCKFLHNLFLAIDFFLLIWLSVIPNERGFSFRYRWYKQSRRNVFVQNAIIPWEFSIVNCNVLFAKFLFLCA